MTQGLPYRDQIPYKTVLGYYLLLPALVTFTSSWAALLAVKVELAIVTSVVVGAALRPRRQFEAPPIVGALLLLCTQSTFLERSSELRVDMLSALFGLVSLLGFLERRALLAGMAAAGALLMTQKGALRRAIAGRCCRVAVVALAPLGSVPRGRAHGAAASTLEYHAGGREVPRPQSSASTTGERPDGTNVSFDEPRWAIRHWGMGSWRFSTGCMLVSRNALGVVEAATDRGEARGRSSMIGNQRPAGSILLCVRQRRAGGR